MKRGAQGGPGARRGVFWWVQGLRVVLGLGGPTLGFSSFVYEGFRHDAGDIP